MRANNVQLRNRVYKLGYDMRFNPKTGKYLILTGAVSLKFTTIKQLESWLDNEEENLKNSRIKIDRHDPSMRNK